MVKRKDHFYLSAYFADVSEIRLLQVFDTYAEALKKMHSHQSNNESKLIFYRIEKRG